MAKFSNNKSDTLITGTAKADSIFNSGDNVTISAGDGNDTIIFDDSEVAGTQYHGFVSVKGGNNYIENPVELSTISTGDGNDTIITGGGTGRNNHWDVYDV